MNQLCVITGVAGSLGCALSTAFIERGYSVFGIDHVEPATIDNIEYYRADLDRIVYNSTEKEALLDAINIWKGKSAIRVLINNAAYQYISKCHPIELEKITRTLNVNLIAPYILTSHLAEDLEKTKGSVINISSIHARLTKPGFSIYASSKAALSMLTKSLAIDFGGKFRVNCIEPAAIDTIMLRDGFNDKTEKINELKSFHPQGRIAQPEEVANLAVKITEPGIDFLHGACIDISGGISSRLHDPE
ncbi:short-chain dehydrogenase [archaeon]|nr:short-chain dehydrogenase [archaeon]|tara:strand:- start:2060 stop:2800 length:741 start_codon:yes stop_codon:yes gene_type:complete